MKVIVFAIFAFVICCHSHVFSFDRDTSSTRKFIHNFSIGFDWAELGRSFPLNQKKLSGTDYGLVQYMSNTRGGLTFGYFGLSIAFKDKFGIEGSFINYDFGSEGTEFNNYISDKHPNHYIPEITFGNRYSINGFGMRFFYRKHFRHFYIEPKLQVCFNAYSGYNSSFRLKEIGSNQFIQYTINRDVDGFKNSYHLMVVLVKRFNPFKTKLKLELGITGEFMICPIMETLSISEKPYGMIGITNSETIRLFNPAFASSFILRFYLENGQKKPLP